MPLAGSSALRVADRPARRAAAPPALHLHQIEAGRGAPIVFVHEFAGDAESWRPQLDHFAATHRCIAFNARGYPPSDVPAAPQEYSQALAADDIAAVVRANGLASAHLVGLSMGSMAVLHCALRHPKIARSITLAGCGPGTARAEFAAWRKNITAFARDYRDAEPRDFTERYAEGPSRRRLGEKNPDAQARFIAGLARRPPAGPRLTLEHAIAHRPRLADLAGPIGRIACPALVVAGDEDAFCLDTALFLKRTIPRARLVVLPETGHAVNQEEPAAFNAALASFLGSIGT